MKKILFIVGLLFAIGVKAQDTPTADAIIEKYLAAIGGKEAIEKIQDLTINLMAEVEARGQQMTIETETKLKKPNKFMTVSYAFGQESGRTISDGTKVYSMRSMMGNTQTNTLEGADATMAILQGAMFPELLYDSYKITKTVLGKEDVNGKATWKVEFATPEGKKWHEFFDTDSGLKLKRSVQMEGRPNSPRPDGTPQAQQPAPDGNRPEGNRQGQGGMRGGMGGMGGNAIYSNYKEIKDGGGVKIPFTREQGGGQFMMKVEVSSVKANKGIKDSTFEIK